ncbi:MAG: Gldg family protein [Bacteroidetes bacterium]|nr:Gldg family protein [Bacteroidota bacterium]
MKTILKIAKTELSLLFYSPIAWFLLVAFLFQSGLAYTSALEGPITSQEMGGQYLSWMAFLTSRVFAPPYGIWPSLVAKLYLYLPLLTMGLMSREINSGTIKLLYSSPIKVREIILGKFLAMMLYNLLLVAILTMMVLFGLFNIRSTDAGLLFSGLLGIYLLLCTYAAIGLFMSCLTAYQVVAALSTLVLLAALSYVGTVWQGIDFVRDLTYFLSISGRADYMLSGLIRTKDLFYFLIIIFIFLSFSIYKLRSDSESIPLWVRISRYSSIVAVALALGYLTSRPALTGYLDATATDLMTLAASGQKIMRETGDEPLEVTTYINLLDNRFFYGRPEQRNADMARWEPYLRFKPDIKFKYVYYYDSTYDMSTYKYNPGMSLKALAEKYSKSMKVDLDMFKTPEEIHRVIDLRPEKNRYVMQLKYKGRTTFLRLFDDQIVFPTESETGAAIKRLMQAKMPKIAFLRGDLERSIDKNGDRQYKLLTNDISFRHSLVNQGFDVQTVSLKEEDIPSDIAALVIADPKAPLDTITVTKIKRYIDDGGNLLIAGEPGKQTLLNPLLQSLHVQLMEGQLMQLNKDFAADLILADLTPAAGSLSRNLQQLQTDSVVTSMRGAAALSYDKEGPFSITPLVMTSPSMSWNKKVRPNTDAIESAESDDMPSSRISGSGMNVAFAANRHHDSQNPAPDDVAFSMEQGDQHGPLPAIVSLTRTIKGKQQRIIVSGDADFLSNSELGRHNPRTSNFVLSTGVFSWLSYGAFPIDSFRPKGPDTRMNLTSKGLLWLKIFLLGILPGLVLIGGSILLIRRKRK